jgi:hypothetical protein
MAAKNLFHYHASGRVLSGRFNRPEQHRIEVQAGTILSVSGGYENSRVENFRLAELVSFKAGYSHVSGSEKVLDDKVIHTTQVTSVVEGLNILDMVTADRIVARMASSYEQGDESKILMLGSRFENLRIAGKKVDVELHEDLGMKLDTFAAVRKEFETNAEFRAMAENFFEPGKLPKRIEIDGVMRCSLVKKVSPGEFTAIERHGRCGHIFVIPEFGKVHLAEVLFEHGRKILTMLRLELGSPIDGDVEVVEADSNGRPPT